MTWRTIVEAITGKSPKDLVCIHQPWWSPIPGTILCRRGELLLVRLPANVRLLSSESSGFVVIDLHGWEPVNDSKDRVVAS